MSDIKRAAVESILSEAGISFAAEYRGLKKNAFGQKGHSMDEWLCVFVNTSRPNEPEDFEFFTGLGLRTPAPMPMDGGPRPTPGTLMHERLEKDRKPVAPHAADVLNCLILDSSAAEQTFADWCADYGYDTDSRKALATYEACQESAAKLRKVFTRDQLAKLSETLEGY